MTAQPLASQPPRRIVAGEDPLAPVPRGALTLAGIAVGLLVLAWLATYFFAFLPRGPVG